MLSLLLIISCQKNNIVTDALETTTTQDLKRTCAAQDVLQEHLAADPSLRTRLQQIEDFTRRKIASGEALRVTAGTAITIPVVVHVLYKTAKENISDAQIQSQIDVLNEDFNLKNADNGLVPAEFSGRKADVGVTFVLKEVIRKATTKKSWQPNDAMKLSSKGGSDAVDPAQNLNIWVCNLGQNLLGYAQFPGDNPKTDGVVILYSAFGRTGTLINTYNKGRTATHEIGHWMNLRHIWGDATCGDDLVGDTPQHTTANYGCPDYPHQTPAPSQAMK